MTNGRHYAGCAPDASDADVGELKDVAMVVGATEAVPFVVGPATWELGAASLYP